MCEGLCHPYRNGFSGGMDGMDGMDGMFVTAMLRASCLFKKPDRKCKLQYM